MKVKNSLSIVNLFQAGAWPLNLTSLSTFSVPQELEKSVQTVSLEEEVTM